MEVPQVIAARRTYPFVPVLDPSSPELTTSSVWERAYVAELKARAPTRRRSAASASLFPAGCEPTIGSSLVSLEVASPARRVIQPDRPDKEQDCRVAEPVDSVGSSRPVGCGVTARRRGVTVWRVRERAPARGVAAAPGAPTPSVGASCFVRRKAPHEGAD